MDTEMMDNSLKSNSNDKLVKQKQYLYILVLFNRV